MFAVLIFAAGMFTANFINNNTPAKPTPPTGQEIGSGPTIPVVYDLSLPETLTLCGEPVPLENRRVWEMLDREFNITVWDRAQVYMYLKRAGRYFPYIEKQLAKAGMPDDLKYLAVAESALITHSRSNKGARGPWQFMTLAARSNGLRRDGVIDERLSFERSTEAALNNLHRLHDKFGSWSLAMAAYNGGETRLRKSIQAQQTDDYYRLNLPLETERYIFRIAAIKIIMGNPVRYGYRLSSNGHYRPDRYDTVKVQLKKPVYLMDLALSIGVDFKDLKELNPHFLRDYLPSGRHFVHVPSGLGMKTTEFFNHNATQNPPAKLVASDRKPRETH